MVNGFYIVFAIFFKKSATNWYLHFTKKKLTSNIGSWIKNLEPAITYIAALKDSVANFEHYFIAW